MRSWLAGGRAVVPEPPGSSNNDLDRRPEAADDDTERLIAQARHFLRFNALPIVASALAVVFAYGLLLTSQSLSEDDELGMYAEAVGPHVGHGRPVAILIEFVTNDLLPLPWFGPALALTFMLAASVLFGFLFLYAARQLAAHRVALFTFLVVVMTLPVNAYFLTFGVIDIPVAVGLLLASISSWFVWLWAAEGWSRSNVISAIMFGVLAGSAYQSLVFVPLAAVLVAQLASILGPGQGQRRRTPDEFMLSVRLVVPMLVVVAASAVVSLILIRGSEYHTSLFRWGTAARGHSSRVSGVGRLLRLGVASSAAGSCCPPLVPRSCCWRRLAIVRSGLAAGGRWCCSRRS